MKKQQKLKFSPKLPKTGESRKILKKDKISKRDMQIIDLFNQFLVQYIVTAELRDWYRNKLKAIL